MTGKIELNLCGIDCEVSYRVFKRSKSEYYRFQFELKNLPLLFLQSIDAVVLSKLDGAEETIWFYFNGRCRRWPKAFTPKDRKKISAIIKNYIVKEML